MPIKFALALIFLFAATAAALAVYQHSFSLIALSCLASLVLIAAGIRVGGWQALNPFHRHEAR